MLKFLFTMYWFFSSKETLINHRKVCLEINGRQSITMPEKVSHVKFTGCHKILKIPFIISLIWNLF